MVLSLFGIYLIFSALVPGVLNTIAGDDSPLFQIRKKAGYEKPVDVSLFFVGDIMLARSVERRMNEYGALYPYEHVREVLKDNDLTIGNHEGIVPRTHVSTPAMAFQFSVQKHHFAALENVGFDILSLANNHGYDFGEDAFLYTKAICIDLGITCGGHPTTLGKSSIEVREVDELRIGFLFFQNVYSTPDVRKLRELLTELEERSDIQIAYVHWGEEYALMHHDSQESLAYMLIDTGVDAVIGHHPHVVQDIALYNGKPIFYSLGNFIFDQYWSEDVLTGAGVQMHITNNEIVYTVVPFTTKDSHTQPKVMESNDAAKLLSRIFASIQNESGVDSSAGVIRLPR